MFGMLSPPFIRAFTTIQLTNSIVYIYSDMQEQMKNEISKLEMDLNDELDHAREIESDVSALIEEVRSLFILSSIHPTECPLFWIRQSANATDTGYCF